jgi:hypothetical protein
MFHLKPSNPLMSQDPPSFHRWHRLVSSWPCQVCGCAQNRRSILDPTCKTCTHVHVPKRETPPASGEGQGDGTGDTQE